MYKKIAIALSIVAATNLFSQNLPVKIEIPAVCTDVNQQFGILNFEATDKGNYSILYYQPLNASVLIPGKEFVQDTGNIVFSDAKKKDAIDYSSNALLLVKQSVTEAGTASTEQVWVLAKRKMESADEYRLYFRHGFQHPIIKTNIPITLTVHNLDNVKGLSAKEFQALSMLVQREFLPPTSSSLTYSNTTLADDITQLNSQFKALKNTGLLFKGDLPKSEDVLSRYSISSEKSMVITKTKGKEFNLKFYLTPDYQKFECVDSIKLSGDLLLYSVLNVYNQKAEISGAISQFTLKSKDEKGEDVSELLTCLLNENSEIQSWKHQSGKNKSTSLQPIVCWYNDDNDLMILNTNGEKFFKPYYQLHKFSKGKQAALLFPATEEEKSSVKFKYVKGLQAENPNGVGTVSPLPDKHIPIKFIDVNNSKYIFAEGFKRNTTTNTDEYLDMNLYRITADKVTGVEDFTSYTSNFPAKINTLSQNPDQAYLMLDYPFKVQLLLKENEDIISSIESQTNRLIPVYGAGVISENNFGVLLLSKTTMGAKYTLLFYPH